MNQYKSLTNAMLYHNTICEYPLSVRWQEPRSLTGGLVFYKYGTRDNSTKSLNLMLDIHSLSCL